MDIATIIGLISAVLIVTAAIMLSAPLAAFIDVPSLLITVGGAICAALISFPMQNLVGVMKVVKNCFFAKSHRPSELIADLVRFAEIARRDGILALDNITNEIKDPFLVTGIQMAVDGNDPQVIENVLMNDLEAIEARHGDGKALFDNIGKYAPAYGMLGTLIGLVIMLRNMADPGSIGPAMAVALITTFYGSVMANMFALPMADKLALRSREEVLLKMIIIRGVMAIQAGDNPRIVEQKLRAFLPPRLRSRVAGAAAAEAA